MGIDMGSRLSYLEGHRIIKRAKTVYRGLWDGPMVLL